MTQKEKNLEVAITFFKLGCLAFGGPAAHIAMMETEIVEKRKWLRREEFLDLIGATNLIPGPNSTEMTMHCGHKRAGKAGLFIAGAAFIFPATLITGILAWFYTTYGELPIVEPFIFGIKPVVLAIITSAILKLGKKALKGWELGIIGVITLVAAILGINEIVALLSAGILGLFYFYLKEKTALSSKAIFPFLIIPTTSKILLNITSIKVFWTFLKVGAILYGSGYVLFAYLDAELVAQGWLSRSELMDAIAVGQFTPGPVLSTATFIGYQLTGFWGVIMATLGIFLPSFLFVLILNPWIPKMRKSKFLGYFLDSVNVAAVAIMLAVLLRMGVETLVNWQAFIIAILSFLITFLFKKTNVMLVILGGAVLGYILSLF